MTRELSVRIPAGGAHPIGGRRPRRRRLLGGVVAAALACGTALAGSATAAAPPSADAPATGPAIEVRDDAAATLVEAALTALRTHATEAGFDTGGPQGLGPGVTLDVLDVLTGPAGSTHVRLQRRLAGLPVIGGDLVVHRAADGGWDGVSATVREPLALALTPTIAPDSAIRTARAVAGTPRLAHVLAPPRLVIDATADQPALAWDVLGTGTQPDGTPSILHSYVDAGTGALRFIDEEIHTVDGHGESLYLGRVPLTTALVSETYELTDISRGGNYTTDAENRIDDCLPVLLALCTSTAPSTIFTDADNRWGSGDLSDRQTVAVDAQYGAGLTWDYFFDAHRRRGIAGDGMGVFSRVHYGRGFANAFWNDRCRCMTYGDGDGIELGPMVALDIVAHEITHGLTARTARLLNRGAAGGLNEATSDIFAAMIEFSANNAEDPGDYLVGETAVLRKDGRKQPRAIRYMHEPSLDGNSPDCHNSVIDELGVHQSAGVGNHFFYLLAEGSKQKTINGITYRSPTCNDKVVRGIGRQKAAQIWFHALTTFFTSAIGYAEAREGTLDSAAGLFGSDSREYDAVAAAWDAVNVVG